MSIDTTSLGDTIAKLGSGEDAHQQRAGRWLCMLALLLATVLGTLDLFAPWESGQRGVNASVYTDPFVKSFLDHGLAVTHAAPCVVLMQDGSPTCYWDWHHPPLYWLGLASVAAVFGHHAWVLKLAHLLLFLPGLAALFALLRNTGSRLLAGFAVLLCASAPLIGYFGPMVVYSGAVLSFGLLSAAALWRYQAAPSKRKWCGLAVLFFLTTMLDYLGHFWGVALFALALMAPHRRRAIIAVLWLFPVSLLSLLVVLLHYGTFLGGPSGVLASLLRLAAQKNHSPVTGTEAATAAREVLLAYGSWPLAALAALGLMLVLVDRSRDRQLPRPVLGVALALMIPATLDCLIAPRHAASHVFWTMSGWTGLALLAAVVPLAGVRLLIRSALRKRCLGAVFLLLAGATVVHGALTVHGLVVRHRAVDGEFPAIVAVTEDLVSGCSCVLTNLSIAMHEFGTDPLVVGNVTTKATLELLLSIGRNNGLGEIAVVLVGQQFEPSMQQHLDCLAPAHERGSATVYRFRP